MLRNLGSARRATRHWVSENSSRSTGFTLVELLVVLTMLAVVLGLAMVRIGSAADREAVRAAAREAVAVIVAARGAAIYRRAPVAVIIDTASATLTSQCDTMLLVRRDLQSAYGVRVAASRDSMAFDARGLGIGAGNLSIVVRRGRSADTVFVSRLGRVRY